MIDLTKYNTIKDLIDSIDIDLNNKLDDNSIISGSVPLYFYLKQENIINNKFTSSNDIDIFTKTPDLFKKYQVNQIKYEKNCRYYNNLTVVSNKYNYNGFIINIIETFCLPLEEINKFDLEICEAIYDGKILKHLKPLSLNECIVNTILINDINNINLTSLYIENLQEYGVMSLFLRYYFRKEFLEKSKEKTFTINVNNTDYNFSTEESNFNNEIERFKQLKDIEQFSTFIRYSKLIESIFLKTKHSRVEKYLKRGFNIKYNNVYLLSTTN